MLHLLTDPYLDQEVLLWTSFCLDFSVQCAGQVVLVQGDGDLNSFFKVKQELGKWVKSR